MWPHDALRSQHSLSRIEAQPLLTMIQAYQELNRDVHFGQFELLGRSTELGQSGTEEVAQQPVATLVLYLLSSLNARVSLPIWLSPMQIGKSLILARATLGLDHDSRLLAIPSGIRGERFYRQVLSACCAYLVGHIRRIHGIVGGLIARTFHRPFSARFLNKRGHGEAWHLDLNALKLYKDATT